MLLLVTRPLPEAASTAAAVERLGHRALIDPVLAVRPCPLPALEPTAVQALILTSARAAGRVPASLRHLPTFAVGPATATAARAVGCAAVREGSGDGRALAALVARSLEPGGGELLHLAGEEVRPGLEFALRERGFAYRRVTAYAAVPVSRLSDATRDALARGQFGGALFFSPRTATLWAELVRAADLTAALGGITAYCLSAAVAEPLRGLPFSAIVVASAPNEDDLLLCLAAPRR